MAISWGWNLNQSRTCETTCLILISSLSLSIITNNRVAEVARPRDCRSPLAGSPSIRAFVAKSVLTRITRYWIHYFQLFSATSTVKMPVFMKNYKFCWQNCKTNDVYVAKICNGKIRCFGRENLQHALRASAVRDMWWSPLARQLLPPWSALLGPFDQVIILLIMIVLMDTACHLPSVIPTLIRGGQTPRAQCNTATAWLQLNQNKQNKK